MMEGITPDRPQYIVYFDHPEAPGKYSVRFFDGSKIAGVQKAAHEKLDAVRFVIPTTHARAPHAQPAPMVEVWVRKELVDAPAPHFKNERERYPRGWHPDDEKRG